MINDLFDKIYLINTKEATDRLKNVTKELNSINIKFKRIEAYSTNNLKLKKNEFSYEGWNINALSLNKTTQKIIKESIKNNYNRVLIFEDDTYVNKNYIDRLHNNLFNFFDKKNDWDFLHLAYSNCKYTNFTPYKDILRVPYGCLRCQAYIINSNIFEEYLKELKKEDKPIDWVVNQLQRKYKKSYILSTKPFYQKENEYSYIREEIVKY